MPSPLALGPVAESWKVSQFLFARASYRAGTRLPAHSHDVATLEVVMAGTPAETIGRRLYDLAEGSVVFKPAGVRHANAYDTSTECLLVEVPEAAALRDTVVEPNSRAWSLNLIRETCTRAPGWQLIVEGLVYEALGHLARLRYLSDRRPPWLDEVVGFARQDRTLAEIAALIGHHPSHIAREFRRHEGVSVGEYARRCRLESACVSLRGTNDPIATVAYAAGFCDQSHFTNAFVRLFGVTPAAYRKWARTSSTTSARLPSRHR